MAVFQFQNNPKLTLFLAVKLPLVLACPDLHWAIGSSFTTDKSRATLQAASQATLAIATWLNPEAKLALLGLRGCFLFLEWLGR